MTILDFRQRLGSRRIEPTPETRFVVLELAKETVGILVDRVRRVVRFSVEDIEPPPRIDVGEKSEVLSGVVERDGRIVVLLDLDHLLEIEEEAESA